MHDVDRTQLEGGPTELGELSEVELGAESSPEVNELEEVELTTELLEATSEQEQEVFLGRLMQRVGQRLGRMIRADGGRALLAILRGVTRRVIPPGVARAGGGGQLLGLELEGLSHEDREYETARQLVRFAVEAARRVAQSGAGPAAAIARQAAALAARRHAPGLFQRLQGRSTGLWPRGGRWIRRGRTIVLLGE